MVYWCRGSPLRPSVNHPVNASSRALASLLLVAVASACLDVGLPKPVAVGFLTQSAHSDDASGFLFAPEATFYGNVNLAVNNPPADSCFIAVVQSAGGDTPIYTTLDAGPGIFTRLGTTRQDTLLPVLSGGILSYRPRLGERIPFVPGDSIEIVVPGAQVGFPSVMLQSRTSEEFTHDPIPTPTAVAAIPFTWTPAPAPGSAMVLSLRYANSFSSGAVNEQIYCGFVDDGSATVPSNLTTGWVNALDGRREIRVTRLRTKTTLLDSGRRFTFISTFTLPLPAFPSGF